MTYQVDSYKFMDGLTRRLIRAWIDREQPVEVPWTGLARPLSECTVAVVSSAAVALRDDEPFDQQGERDDPWWGDPSFRTIPRDATEADVALYHLHVNTSYAEQDLDCLLPLERLLELERRGEIGASAPSHYSFMGYLLKPETLLEEHLPGVIRDLRAEEVDVVVLVPV